MFTMIFLRGTGLTRSLQRVPKASIAVHPRRTPKQPSPFLRTILSTSKPAASQSFHSQARLSARPRQQWSREWQQQKQDDYHRYQNARPLLSPSAFKSPSFKWIIALSIGGATIFYFTHIETVPVSGRKRFNCFSEESAEAQGEMAYRQILEQERRLGKILGEWDPRTRMVHRVMAKLIEGGDLGTGAAEGKPVGWEINVIHDDCEFYWRAGWFLGS
jgi:metalloendopeptidase OMA1, mitochondrial